MLKRKCETQFDQKHETKKSKGNDFVMGGNFVIAGGSKGIGLELVRLLSTTADRIDVYSREMDELVEDDKVKHHQCDFTEDDIVLDDLPDEVHGVAYCPGSINLRSFRGLKVDDFRQDFEINVVGAVKFLQGCLTALKKGAGDNPSSVVMFSTVAVAQGLSMHSSIASAKGAIEGLTRTLASELAPKVRVNCIAPALTETSLAAKFFENEDNRKAMAAKYALGRTGKPIDLAAMAEFLLLPSSSWMTGQVIGVDGGMSTLRQA